MSEEEDRKGHTEEEQKWERHRQKAQRGYVVSVWEENSKLSYTITLFSLAMSTFGVSIWLLFWCKKTTQRHTDRCTGTLFALLILTTLNTSFPLSIFNYVCVCVCPYLLCKLILYLPHSKLWADKPAWQWRRKEIRLFLLRVYNKWSFVPLCKCTVWRQIQWKQQLTALNKHFNQLHNTGKQL